MQKFLDLLACPMCRGTLDSAWNCRGCGARYCVSGGTPDLRLPGDTRTETVRQFYGHAPFPGYRARDSLEALRTRAERSEFARLLDAAIAPDARIVEIGCGTGQMSLYLARADRIVIGADLTRASLALGAAAARRFGVDGVQFVEDRPAPRPGLHAPAPLTSSMRQVFCITHPIPGSLLRSFYRCCGPAASLCWAFTMPLRACRCDCAGP